MTDAETDGPDFSTNSILSHGERRVARHLHENPEAGAAEIAEARGSDPEAVAKSIDRIREKTVRALATLDQSPFVSEAVDEDPDAAVRVAESLDGGDFER